MSFSGEFARYAREAANDLAVVLEVTLNEATWDPGTGTLTANFNVSDKAVKARTRAYEPRVTKGGWGGLRQTIELRAAGLSSLTTSVIVADNDGHVRAMLVNGAQRQSVARIVRVVPGSDDDYDTRFTGLLDSWEYTPGQVRLNFKTDERPLKSYFPNWVYLKSEWYQMSDDSVGKPIPLIYGKHDSTNLNLNHGMIPTTGLWIDANNGWYGTNLGPADWIKDVYVTASTTTTKQAYTTPLAGGNAYEKIYGSYAGGKTVTMIEFNGGFFPNPENDKVTADVYGYCPAGVVSKYDGNGVATNPVTQLRHFLVNFAVNRSRGGGGGVGWSDSAAIIDSPSWDLAATWANNHGLEGSRYMDSTRTALSVITEWGESFPMFRPFWNSEGKIEMRILSADWPGYWDGTTDIITREDSIGNAFHYETDPSDVTGKIKVEYLSDSVDNKFLRTLDVQDLSVNELQDTSLPMYWSPARQV